MAKKRSAYVPAAENENALYAIMRGLIGPIDDPSELPAPGTTAASVLGSLGQYPQPMVNVTPRPPK